MRILFAGGSLLEPAGGGEISARSLLEALAARHQVRALTAGPRARAQRIAGFQVRELALDKLPPGLPAPNQLRSLLVEGRFRAALLEELRRADPELLLLQQPAWLRPADVPAGLPLVIFIRSPHCYGIAEPSPSARQRLLGAAFRRVRAARGWGLLERADLLLCNSQHTQELLRTHTNLLSRVLPPFIKLEPGAADPRGAICFVGLDRWKGARLALRIARALPDRRFLFVAGSRGSRGLLAEARRLPQVRCIEHTTDMAGVFRQTRLLLVPSLWQEPFGRVPVEAGAFGIPSIAAATGGLAEAVGPGGILLESRRLACWLDAIAWLDVPATWSRLSAAARRHAQGLGLETSVAQLTALLRSQLGLEL